jgi:hypothetical protein
MVIAAAPWPLLQVPRTSGAQDEPGLTPGRRHLRAPAFVHPYSDLHALLAVDGLDTQGKKAAISALECTGGGGLPRLAYVHPWSDLQALLAVNGLATLGRKASRSTLE